MKWRISLLQVVFGILTCSCSTMHRVPLPLDALWPSVVVDQEVDVLMINGETFYRFRVLSKAQDQLVGLVKGEQRTLKRADIRSMEPTLAHTKRRKQLAELKVGARLQISLKSGKTVRMKFRAFDEEKIYGKKDGREVIVSFAEVSKMLYKKHQPAGTIAVVVIVGGGVVMFVGALEFASLNNSYK